MSDLQQVLKEYLELPDDQISAVINILLADWSPKIANKVPDIDTAALLEELLGVPNWTEQNT